MSSELGLDVWLKERARLSNELAILDHQWRRKHYLSVFVVLAIPGWYFGGPAWGFAFVAMTPALILTQAYLLAVRRRECIELLSEAKREVSRLEQLEHAP